ncbi:hypothetical protein [Jiangella asiatica]|uniref:Acyltransferase n=1 Tax=Jiangella asiatica TaxID=2530372 RepID=A0A4R5CP28_9ACTN|nr:hypothetical protein [Jiangella asiatica]TDE02189.1 hypothetical protein E1269_21950 [Jiangella asiatica]
MRTAASPRAAQVPAPRDGFADVVGVAAAAMLVAVHWLGPQPAGSGTVAAAGPVAIVLTAPLAFVSAAAGRTATVRRLSEQARGLAALVVPFAAIALPLIEGAARLLWLPAALLLVTSMAPALRRLHRRWRGVEVVGLAGVAAAADVVGLGVEGYGGEVVGGFGVLAAWVAAYQAGVLIAAGRQDRVRPSAALGLAAAGGCVVAVTLVLGALAGTDHTTDLPSAALVLAATAAQVGLALAVRPLIRRWAAPVTVGGGLAWVARRLPAVQLWHLPAAAAVAGAAGRLGTGDDLGARLVATATVLAVLVQVAGRIERVVAGTAVGTTPRRSHRLTGSSTLAATGKVEA